MKILRYSSQFKKDAKRYRNQPKKMERVAAVCLQCCRMKFPYPKSIFHMS